MEDRDATSGMIRIDKIDLTTIIHSCRICMSHNVKMNALFEKDIIEQIIFCTGVCLKNEDGLPNNICTQCLKDLFVAHKFKMSCISADKVIRTMIVEAGIKVEEAAGSETECEDIVKYEEEMVESCDEKVKLKIELEPVVEQNVKKIRRVKKEKAESVGPKLPRRRGRPKTSGTAVPPGPRRKKKFKFRRLHCELCDIKFDNKQQCDEHRKQEHKIDETWICEICGKMFIHRASHYTHIKSHLPPKYGCDQCDYKTWHKYDLVKHIRIHTGIKMYQCEYCTASYYTSSNLTGHIRRHHMKQRPFECTICRMTFFDRTKLNRHVDSHNEVKRFECEVCHVCFTRRCYWKKHLLRQHDIVIPPQRPGRQKTNAVVGENLISKVNLVLTPAVPDDRGYQIEKVDKEF